MRIRILLPLFGLLCACSGSKVELTPGGDLQADSKEKDSVADITGGQMDADVIGADAPFETSGDLEEVERVEDVLVEPELVGDVVHGDHASLEFTEYLCAAGYCNADNECEEINYSPECVTKCVEKATADEEFLKRLVCAKIGGEEPGEWCTRWAECSGTYSITQDCIDVCGMIADCDGLNNPAFGYSKYDCSLVCSALANGYPFPADTKECLVDALSECSGLKFMGCIEAVKNPCEPLFCGPEVPDECALIPDFYATTEDCLAVCQDWSLGQSLAAGACVEAGMNIPGGKSCAESNYGCMEVPADLPDGALDYCIMFVDKCGGKDDGLGSLGKLGYDICAWQLTGISLQMKGIFVSFVDAVKCVENLEVCPTDELTLMYCLLGIPEWGKELCTKVEALCGEGPEARELTYQCEAITVIITAWVPEAIESFNQCVNDAESCEALVANCLQVGSEEQARW